MTSCDIRDLNLLYDKVWGGKKRVPSCSKITLSYFGFFILRNNDERREDVDRSDS